MLIFGLWGGADILALLCLVLISPISFVLVGGIPSIYNPNYLQMILPIGLTMVMNAAILQAPLPLFIAAKNFLTYRKQPELYQLPEASLIKKTFASFLGEPLPISTILTKPMFYYQVLETNTLFKQSPEPLDQFPVPFIRLASEPLVRWKQFRRSSFRTLQPNMIQNSRNKSPLRKSKTSDKEWSFDFTIGLKSEEEDLFRQRTIIKQAATKGPLQKHNLWVQYSIPFLIPMFIGYVLAFNNINILFLLLKFMHLL